MSVMTHKLWLRPQRHSSVLTTRSCALSCTGWAKPTFVTKVIPINRDSPTPPAFQHVTGLSTYSIITYITHAPCISISAPPRLCYTNFPAMQIDIFLRHERALPPPWASLPCITIARGTTKTYHSFANFVAPDGTAARPERRPYELHGFCQARVLRSFDTGLLFEISICFYYFWKINFLRRIIYVKISNFRIEIMVLDLSNLLYNIEI